MEEWQKIHIQKNLVELVKATTCNIQLITRFIASGILNGADEESLTLPHLTPFEKCKKLYDILQTRVGAYEILLNGLKETGQTGAVQILENHNPILRAVGRITYDENHVLGTGSSGTKVYKGKHGGRDVAVKVVYAKLMGHPKVALHEIKVLEKVDCHENVMRYFHAVHKHNLLLIALELCVISLQDEIKLNLIQMTPIDILSGCTKGLAHLHRNKIIHRDLKPANIMFTENKQVKIADFGVSKEIPAEGTGITVHSGVVGTADWLAPEIMPLLFEGSGTGQYIRMSASTDIFSLGCIYVFTLTKGSHPFGEASIRQHNILKYTPQLDILNIETHWLDLVREMIALHPSSRPSADEILSSICFRMNDTTATMCQLSLATSGEESAETSHTTNQTSTVSHGDLITSPVTRGRHYRVGAQSEHIYVHNFGMLPQGSVCLRGINIGVQLGVLCAAYPLYFVRTIMQLRFDYYRTFVKLPDPTYLNFSSFRQYSNHIMRENLNNRFVFYYGLSARIAQHLAFTFVPNAIAKTIPWIQWVPRAHDNGETNILSNTMSNIVWATAGTFISHPFYVLAVSAVNCQDSGTLSNDTVFKIGSELYKSHGISGFFTGVFPRVLGTVLYIVMFEITYKSLISISTRRNWAAKYPRVTQIFFSVFANVVARSVTYFINSAATGISVQHGNFAATIQEEDTYSKVLKFKYGILDPKFLERGLLDYLYVRAQMKDLGRGAIATSFLPFILL